MAATNAEILGWLQANPTATDADIANAMAVAGVNPAQLAQVVGVSEGEVAARVAATIPQGSSVTLGDTVIVPQYRVTGSGMDEQIGPLETFYVSKSDGDVNYKAPVGSEYKQYGADGTFQRTGTTQKELSFFGGLADAFNDPVVQAAFLGLGGGGALGNALGLTGSTAQAVGTGLFKGGAAAAGGASFEDALKTGLLSGGLVYGGAQLSDYIKANTPIDASNMTSAQFNDALEGKLVADMQSAGLSKDQITAFLDDMGIGQGVVTNVATPTTDVLNVDTVNITGAKAPTTLNNVLSTIGTVPTVNVTAAKPQQVSQNILDAVTTQLVSNQSAIPTVNVTAQKPTTVNDVIAALATTGLVANVPTVEVAANRPITSKDDLDSVISSLVTTGTVAPTTTIPEVKITETKPPVVGDALAAVTTIPTTLTNPPTTTTTTPTKETDPIKLAQLALAAAGLLGAGSVLSNNGTGTQFPIVPIPDSFVSPPAPSVAPYSPLAPINFGNRNLLIGTQWEKFLDPNYGQIPEPVQYSQPSNLSYNDLMGILGSKQGMPAKSSLSINDVISGIQNQYGQTPTRTMG
jgi:hypothetical protein